MLMNKKKFYQTNLFSLYICETFNGDKIHSDNKLIFDVSFIFLGTFLSKGIRITM